MIDLNTLSYDKLMSLISTTENDRYYWISAGHQGRADYDKELLVHMYANRNTRPEYIALIKRINGGE